MRPEISTSVEHRLTPERHYESVELSETEVRTIRMALHEIANVFTGMMLSGGLLQHALKGDLRERYAAEICGAGERGSKLVREARGVLVARSEQDIS